MDKQNQPKQGAIIWLVKSGLYLYAAGYPSVISLDFPEEIVRYFDVLDQQKFQQLIFSFLSTNKLPPLRIYIIVGPDALIEKEFVNRGDEQKSEERKILDNAPFENVYSKTWSLEKSKKIVVFNADFYQSIKNSFEKTGSVIEWVIPYFVTGQSSFNREIALSLLEKQDSLKQETVISDIIFNPTPSTELSEIEVIKTNKSSLPLLIGVFSVLVVILVLVIFMRPQTPNQTPLKNKTIKPTIKTGQTSLITPTMEASPTAVIVPTIAYENLKKTLKMKIISQAELASQATFLQNQLKLFGFNNIELNETPSMTSQKNIVMVKSSIPQAVRKEIYSIFNKTNISISSQENNTIVEDIIIFFVKNQ